MNKNVLKKVISVLLVVVMIFAFAACKSKSNGPEAIEVTDENGQAVTDANGNPVTESVEIEDVDNESSQSEGTASQGGSGSAGSEDANSGDDNAQEAKTTTSAKETTEAKKRDVSVTVKLPFKNDEKSVMTVLYRTNGDTEYTKLDPIDVTLSGQEETVELGNFKGPVRVIVYLSGVDVAPNSNVVTIGSAYSNAVIEPKIGIEIADGGWD